MSGAGASAAASRRLPRPRCRWPADRPLLSRGPPLAVGVVMRCPSGACVQGGRRSIAQSRVGSPLPGNEFGVDVPNRGRACAVHLERAPRSELSRRATWRRGCFACRARYELKAVRVVRIPAPCFWLAAAFLGFGCVTTSRATRQRIESCVRRCEEAGTPAQNQFPFTSQHCSLSACDRRCGTYSPLSLRPSGAQESAAHLGKPTFTGSEPRAAVTGSERRAAVNGALAAHAFRGHGQLRSVRASAALQASPQ